MIETARNVYDLLLADTENQMTVDEEESGENNPHAGYHQMIHSVNASE
jgi:hypothetical protein